MTLVKRNTWPFRTPRSNWDDRFAMDRFFDSDWMKPHNLPAVNVKETDDAYEIELAAPGLNKDDFHVTVENSTLTISSEKKEEKEEKEENYQRKEFSYSSFSRSFSLPENVNEDDVNAKYSDGVLKLTLGKTKETDTTIAKKIAIG